MAHYAKRDERNAKLREMIANAKPPPGPFIPLCAVPGCDDPGPKRFQNGRAFHCDKHSMELLAEMNAKEEADRLKSEERKKLFDAIRARRTSNEPARQGDGARAAMVVDTGGLK